VFKNSSRLRTEESLGYATLCVVDRVFPLTLTLSLREREQLASNACLADGRWANSDTGVIDKRWTILPLPKGEGRGEGEPSVVHPTVQPVTFLASQRFVETE